MADPRMLVPQQGRLVDGHFFFLWPNNPQREGAIASTQGADEALTVRDWKTEVSSHHNCRLSKSHVSSSSVEQLEVEVGRWGNVLDFVENDTDLPIVTEAFAHELNSLSFKGLDLMPVQVHGEPAGTRLFTFRVDAPCLRFNSIQPASANRCYICNYMPICCPECGFKTIGCPICDGDIMRTVADDRTDKRQITIEPYDPQSSIVELKRWNGNDFVGQCYELIITRRVRDALGDAAPYWLEPIRVNVEGATKQQMEMLKASAT